MEVGFECVSLFLPHSLLLLLLKKILTSGPFPICNCVLPPQVLMTSSLFLYLMFFTQKKLGKSKQG